MRSNNNHETITHLAMPERQIPVLIDSSPEKAEGYVPSIVWSGKPVTSVRRLLPSFVDGLRNPRKRREIEKEHGAVSATEWNRLRELLALIDRLNAGDKSPVTVSNVEEVLEPIVARLGELSPEGWFLENEPGTGRLVFRSASGKGRVELDFGEPSITPFGHAPLSRDAAQHLKTVTEGDGESTRESIAITGTCKTVTFAVSEAFTAGLSKTRFVVWWSEVGKKLVPGLYCPDIVTALYALAMWSSGTAGGWAICQKCGNDYPRSRAKQRYCSHKCQVAAAMKRYRANLERKTKSKTTTKGKKRKGRE